MLKSSVECLDVNFTYLLTYYIFSYLRSTLSDNPPATSATMPRVLLVHSLSKDEFLRLDIGRQHPGDSALTSAYPPGESLIRHPQPAKCLAELTGACLPFSTLESKAGVGGQPGLHSHILVSRTEGC